MSKKSKYARLVTPVSVTYSLRVAFRRDRDKYLMSTLSKRGFRCGSLKIFKLKRNFFFKTSGSSGPCAFGIPPRPPGPVWKPLISESLPGLLLLLIKTETGTCRWRWGRDRVESPAYFSQSLSQISASVNAFITCIRKRIAVFSSTNSTYTCHHLLKSA